MTRILCVSFKLTKVQIFTYNLRRARVMKAACLIHRNNNNKKDSFFMSKQTVLF